MKTIKNILLSLALTGTCIAHAQNKAAVMAIDTKGIILEPQQVSNLLRIELEKTGAYKVTDKYDQQGILDQKKIDFKTCLSKTCLVEAGKALAVDKVISGSVERFDEKILVTIRIIDVRNPDEEKTQVSEFRNLQPEIQQMLSITLNTILGLKNEEETSRRLTRPFDYEGALNNPGSSSLSLSGPRMGMTYLTGVDGKRIMDGKQTGGYDAFPVMSQFGYQFETQYLNHGNFQALVEVIPTITGIDQGFFIPSVTVLNGFRNNRNGLEFAFGPALGFAKKSSGYYENNVWHEEREWNSATPNPNAIVERLDRRGDVFLTSGFVFAVGKTFKSGALNIPVNAYVIPGKTGTRIGLSFGFNLKK